MSELKNSSTSGQILAIAAGLCLTFAYGLISNTMGLFLVPVTEGLHCTRAEFNLYFTIMSAASIIAAPIFSRVIGNIRMTHVILTGCVIGTLSYAAFAASKTIGTIYVASVFLGLIQQICTSIAAVTVVKRVFADEAGFATGLVMTGTGICGAGMGWVLPPVIAAYGWQAGYLIQSGLWFVLTMAAYLLVKRIPDEEPSNEKPAEAKEKAGTEEKRAKGTGRWNAKFCVMFLCILLSSMTSIYIHHMPPYFQSCGRSSAESGRLVSMFSIVSIPAKLVLGWLYDRGNKALVSVIEILCMAAGMVMMLNPSLLMPGTVLFAAGIPTITVLFPLITGTIFGREEYAAVWTLLSMAVSLGTAMGSPLWGLLYDVTGSYRSGMIVMPGVVAAAAFLIWTMMKMTEEKKK